MPDFLKLSWWVPEPMHHQSNGNTYSEIEFLSMFLKELFLLLHLTENSSSLSVAPPQMSGDALKIAANPSVTLG